MLLSLLDRVLSGETPEHARSSGGLVSKAARRMMLGRGLVPSLCGRAVGLAGIYMLFSPFVYPTGSRRVWRLEESGSSSVIWRVARSFTR